VEVPIRYANGHCDFKLYDRRFADWAKACGVLLPSDRCGRTSLYSRRHARAARRAASRVSNHDVLSNSLRTLELNDSANALSVGFPGREV
jgi:hypothetical protein